MYFSRRNQSNVYAIYNLVVKISGFFLKVAAPFSEKLRLFVSGRKLVFPQISESISKEDKVIWIHVASLGEFEQGLPIIESLGSEYPSHKIVVTFFSPSGYEVKKNSPAADVICYLPMDTQQNASRFLDAVHPVLAIFVKYEVWPNYLRELQKRRIPAILISAIFKEDQVYFKGYGGFMRKALRKFDHYFVQDVTSRERLASIQIKNVTISGDTRLDRVSEILDRDNHLAFMKAFKNDRLCLVAGSTWTEDEAILIDYINNAPRNLKYILAPHTVKKDKILGLAGAITKKTMLYSNIGETANGSYGSRGKSGSAMTKNDILESRQGVDGQSKNPDGHHGGPTIKDKQIDTHSPMEKELADCQVLIIDTVGLLTKIYSYADIAYVGGGFVTGLHNTLEPAVFGVPVIIGPNYKGFKEAEDLVAQKGILPVKDAWSFGELLKKLLDNPDYRKKTGAINANYIAKNKGASTRIMAYIRTLTLTNIP